MKNYTFDIATARHAYGQDAGFASDPLREELAAHAAAAAPFPVVNLAYTDYGGEFFDIIVMDYFLKHHPEHIITETTGWNGRNAFLFGDVAAAFIEETEKYPLGFENLEDYYYTREKEEYDKTFASFAAEELRGYAFDPEAVLSHLREKYESNCNVTTQGVDHCSGDWVEELTREGLVTKTEED